MKENPKPLYEREESPPDSGYYDVTANWGKVPIGGLVQIVKENSENCIVFDSVLFLLTNNPGRIVVSRRVERAGGDIGALGRVYDNALQKIYDYHHAAKHADGEIYLCPGSFSLDLYQEHYIQDRSFASPQTDQPSQE